MDHFCLQFPAVILNLLLIAQCYFQLFTVRILRVLCLQQRKKKYVLEIQSLVFES